MRRQNHLLFPIEQEKVLAMDGLKPTPAKVN
jgi:hypothetical protein